MELRVERFVVNEEIRKDIVNCAVKSPTGDNAQHWQYSWENDRLLVRHLENTASHILNDHHYSSLLSLGCVVESISISAKHHGLLSYFDFNLDNPDDSTWLKVGFQPGVFEEDLYESLFQRHTNRYSYSKENISEQLKDSLLLSGADYGVELHIVSKFSKELLKYVKACEQYVWSNYRVFKDTVKWLRFNKEEELETRDGMNLSNVKIKPFEAPMVKLLQVSKFAYKVMWYLGMSLKVKFETAKQFADTPYMIFFSAELNSRESYVNVGRSMFRAWCLLNKNSFGVQPLTVSSLLPVILEKEGALRECNESYMKYFSEAPDLFKTNLNLAQNKRIVWGLRTGKAKPLPVEKQTLRKIVP